MTPNIEMTTFQQKRHQIRPKTRCYPQITLLTGTLKGRWVWKIRIKVWQIRPKRINDDWIRVWLLLTVAFKRQACKKWTVKCQANVKVPNYLPVNNNNKVPQTPTLQNSNKGQSHRLQRKRMGEGWAVLGEPKNKWSKIGKSRLNEALQLR